MTLIPITSGLSETLAKGNEAFKQSYGVDPTPVAEQLRPILEATLQYYSRNQMAYPWLGYLAVAGRNINIVGTCAFKSNPTPDRTVEIAYNTFPPFEGKGYAKLMVENLVDIAETSYSVDQIIAHTLPQQNASVRVLEKNKFRCDGETVDPEDGTVWKWVKEIQST